MPEQDICGGGGGIIIIIITLYELFFSFLKCI
jgi:hypothetical protein